MPLSELMRDTISLLKQNGESIEGIKASVQAGRVFIQRSDILIEPKDLIRRRMSNGGEETFEVIDPGFHEGLGSISAGYQVIVRKLGIPEAKQAVHHITYNISGPNARVNNNSTDNSSNVVNMNPDIHEHITALRAEVERISLSAQEKHEALEVVDAIEGQFETGRPSKTIVRTLINALPSAGSIASIGSFLLSILG